MKRTIDIIKAHSVGEPGAWKKQAQEELEAWDWRQYSFLIAAKVRGAMTRKGITQKQLAEAMGCTQQYVSLVLKGNLNLTLETISRLEKALGLRILENLFSTESTYMVPSQEPRYLSDGKAPEYGTKPENRE
jgi:transcriptional regulator with XRE-family HTH domain